MALLPDSAVATGVLIGLGGGGLVNLWHLLKTAWTVTAIELDPAVAEIAAEYFGLDCTKLEVRIGDGLSVHSLNGAATGTNTTNDPAVDSVKLNYSDVGEKHAGLGFEAESLDFIVIDVDSKDTKIGMSCPPAAFVEGIFLETLSSLLRKNTGVLAINVSARDPTMFQDVCKAVRSVFPSVILSKRCFSKEGDNDDDDAEKEDLNVVVFASRRPDESLPSPRELANRVTLRIQHLQKSNITSEIDEILLSDLCSCLEEFAVFDESATRSAPTKSNAGKKKTTGSNKRRNNKRGSNKRR